MTMKAADPIVRPKLYQEIARRLECEILEGCLQPGDALPTNGSRSCVTAPAVREALVPLQKAGLIAIKNGERARVILPSAESLVGEPSSMPLRRETQTGRNPRCAGIPKRWKTLAREIQARPALAPREHVL